MIRFAFICLLVLPLPGYGGESIFSRNDVQSIQLSPDGEHFALLKRRSDSDALFIVNIFGKNVTARRTTREPERIHSIAWLDSARLVQQIGKDARHQQMPQPSGLIEILTLSGDSSWYGDAGNSKPQVHKALAGKPLFLVDALRMLPGVILVASEIEKALWLLDVRTDGADTESVGSDWKRDSTGDWRYSG